MTPEVAIVVRGVIGVLLVLVGAVWFAQGVGVLGGSAMTGDALWAVIGAPMVVAGLVLVRGATRARRARSHTAD